MKLISTMRGCLLALLLAGPRCVHAQPARLGDELKKQTISNIATLVADNYVFPDIAQKTGSYLLKQFEQGFFSNITDPDSFSVALTRTLQSVNHDKHMRVRFNRTGGMRPGVPRNSAEGADGIAGIQWLEGNAGYIKLNQFHDLDIVKNRIDSCMEAMSGAAAIIFDLREMRGGRPGTVQYLCSYFFKQHVALTSIYDRGTNQTTSYSTVAVKGRRLLKMPVYVLTSTKTFSAGEAFCYELQARKRGLIVGETTAGGANPGRVFTVNDSFTIFIPTGKAIHPVTKTNWEGTGVQPDVRSSAADALSLVLNHIKGNTR